MYKVFLTFQRGLRVYKFNINYEWLFDSGSGYYWRCFASELPNDVVLYYGGSDDWCAAVYHTMDYIKHLPNLSKKYKQ